MSLSDNSEDISFAEKLSLLHQRSELPKPLFVQAGETNSPGEKKLLFGKRIQRSSDTVKDTSKEPRAEIHRKEVPGVLHPFPCRKARGILINLDIRPLFPKTHHLPHEVERSHPNHFEHAYQG
jgi:hypothetical protein